MKSQQPDLFNPDPQPTAIVPAPVPEQISFWENSNKGFCFVVLKGEQVNIFICPVCRAYNKWEKIPSGTCLSCNSRNGNGFQLDVQTKIALVGKNAHSKTQNESYIDAVRKFKP